MNPEINKTWFGPPEIEYGKGSDTYFLCWSSKDKRWETISAAFLLAFFRHYLFWCYISDGVSERNPPPEPTQEEWAAEEEKWVAQEKELGLINSSAS